MHGCRELVELVTDYLEGAVGEARHTEVARHLNECDDCLRYVSQLQLTGRVLASISVDALPAADRAVLVASYRNWCASQR